MKFLGLLLLMPVPALAITVSDPQLVRMIDGHAVNCKATYEGGRTAFVPAVQGANADENVVSLALNLKFQICVRNGKDVHFADRKPLDPVFTYDIYGNVIRTEFRSPQLLIGSDGTASYTVLPIANEISQPLGFQFTPAQMLTKRELADFAAGKPVRVRLTVMYRSVERLSTRMAILASRFRVRRYVHALLDAHQVGKSAIIKTCRGSSIAVAR